MHSVKSLRDSQLFSNSLPMGVSLLLPLRPKENRLPTARISPVCDLSLAFLLQTDN